MLVTRYTNAINKMITSFCVVRKDKSYQLINSLVIRFIYFNNRLFFRNL